MEMGQLDWLVEMEALGTEEAWRLFKTTVQDLVDKHVPTRIIRTNGMYKDHNPHTSINIYFFYLNFLYFQAEKATQSRAIDRPTRQAQTPQKPPKTKIWAPQYTKIHSPKSKCEVHLFDSCSKSSLPTQLLLKQANSTLPRMCVIPPYVCPISPSNQCNGHPVSWIIQ